MRGLRLSALTSLTRVALTVACGAVAACQANRLTAAQPCDPIGTALPPTGPADSQGDGALGDPAPGDDAGVPSVCDPVTQPAPQWAERDGVCLASCARLGGDACVDSTSCPAGWVLVPLGPAYDCGACCVWGHAGGGCLDHCGGTSPDGTCECDLGCLVRGDCCDDFKLVCD